MKSIGTTTFTNFVGLINWFLSLTWEDGERIYAEMSKNLRSRSRDDDESIISSNARDMLELSSWASHPHTRTREYQWPEHQQKIIAKFREHQMFATTYKQSLNVGRWVEGDYAYIFMGNPEKGLVIPEPEKYLAFTPHKDYSQITPAELRLALNMSTDASVTGMLPANQESSLTHQSLAHALGEAKTEMSSIEQEMDDVKKAKTEELAVLKAEIDAKIAELDALKSSLMAELNDKKREMEEKMEQFENQIYLLDSQIYSICCYAGEVVKFGQIRSGKNAPDDEPIVLHQKLRFLDEDLGAMASLYELRWEEIGMFEEFLKHSPLALDTFAPNERCIMLIRLSKNAIQLGRSSKFPHSNMLEKYAYYHGKTVGIVIRNGENVYLGWTEEDRVHIQDDIIGYVIDTSPAEMPDFDSDWEEESFIKKQKSIRKEMVDDIISRLHVYNILQGVVDNTPILPLPEGIKLDHQSEYVLYAMADKWLSDNRFGSFNDIIGKCNVEVSKGDMVLTVQNLTPERRAYRSYTSAWQNSRGRGEANRTHDCSVADCSIYPINLIECDDDIPKIRYKSADGRIYTMTAKESYDKKFLENNEILEEFSEKGYRHIFVSVEKTYSLSGNARANFSLHKDEYINLTYMNSVWLQWAITNKKMGGWRIKGNDVDYAYAIKYLKTAMDFIRKREVDEKALIDQIDISVCADPDWPLKLTEWKMATGVRNITEFQAKRFVRSLANSNKGKGEQP